VHAIMERDAPRPSTVPAHLDSTDEDPGAHLKTEDNEAEWGFTR